ncbi:MAG TPA: cytochrome c [Dongiaceae bacterium]|nr:cytochrome c [Dongiaceae bacterium]
MRKSFAIPLLLPALLLAPAALAGAPDPQAAQRGAYIFAVAGCAACHTDVKNKGPLLAGGRALATPFGTFYGPNITPDPVYGIGLWSDADFIRALRDGMRPDGAHLFPVFPYPSFTLMTDADMLDLKAYIFSLPAAASPSRAHDVSFPFSWRWLQTFWRWLNFTPGPFEPDPHQSAAWNRGAYLVRALAHCGECHTPRDLTGGLENDLALSGNPKGPDNQKVPNITPDKATGIGSWSHNQIVTFLRSGILPNGDVVGSTMGEVIANGTSKMTDADRDAVATYLMSLPPHANPAAKAVQAGFD